MIRIREIKINILNDNETYLLNKIKKILNCEIKTFKINKKSLDARNKKQICYVYEVDVQVDKEEEVLKKYASKNILKAEVTNFQLPEYGKEILKNKIVIVGSGPAGLFAAYMLALKGFKPLIIERGEEITKRVETVEKFWTSGILKADSNVQFGEGGAGTFSDGKLNTMSKEKNKRGFKVLEVFTQFGAPQEILYLQHPHIGTDILRNVVINMREFIKSKGGEFRYNTKLTDLIIKDNKLVKIIVNDQEEIDCSNLILAIGHSARDTFKMFYDCGLKMENKAFAVGVRVMHEQQMINESEYGKMAKYLPNANYKLTYTTKKGRGVYSFCMCPGGYVVNASSENGKLVINGMSNYKRDSGVANSAIIVTVAPDDYGNNIFDGMNFQRQLETLAFKTGKGNIPLETWKDFKENIPPKVLGKLEPKLKGKYTIADINAILPDFIKEAIKEAMPNFGAKIKGFDNDDTIMCAVEARSSSPVRILRDENMEANIKGIYPIGEGSGYAGGITTSAIDGIKVAEKLISKYQKI